MALLMLSGACTQLRDAGETNVEVDPCDDAEGTLSWSLGVYDALVLTDCTFPPV